MKLSSKVKAVLVGSLLLVESLFFYRWLRKSPPKIDLAGQRDETGVGPEPPQNTPPEEINVEPPVSAVEPVKAPSQSGISPQTSVLFILEITLIVVWALIVGQDYINFRPTDIPNGSDFPIAVESHFIWNLLPRCGTCMLWNGFMNGGAPAFVETHGAVLHPLVILTTLLWGVANGSKVLLLLILIMAGLAQWWLGYVLKFGRIARVLPALIAVAGGHLAGKMELGIPLLLLSVVSASMALPPAIDLFWNGNRRALPLLAAALGLTWLSGQGYIQVGLVATWIPAFLLLLPKKSGRWKQLALALILSALIASLFLVPFLHFSANFGKVEDPALRNPQTVEYSPLNLVIHDENYFTSIALGHDSTPFSYIIYIGWVPVILAILALRLAPRSMGRLLAFFFTAAFLPFLVTSSEVLKTLIHVIPSVASLRFFAQATSLSVPPILGLAGLSLNELDTRLQKFTLPPILKTPDAWVSWILAALLAAAALIPTYNYAREFYKVHPLTPNDTIDLSQPQAEWVSTNIGNFEWNFELIEKGTKVTRATRPWDWTQRSEPQGILVVDWVDNQKMVPTHNPEAEYASIEADGQVYPCKANAQGGYIDVSCNSDKDGVLTVYENNWDGWYAWMNGRPLQLEQSQWLQMKVPAGQHTYTFRYRPWDVWVGLILTLIGTAVCVNLFFHPQRTPEAGI